jgi:hypothetical protein
VRLGGAAGGRGGGVPCFIDCDERVEGLAPAARCPMSAAAVAGSSRSGSPQLKPTLQPLLLQASELSGRMPRRVRAGVPVAIANESFEGTLLLFARNPAAPVVGPAGKRLWELQVQGRFRKPIDNFYMGMEVTETVKPSFFLRGVSAVLLNYARTFEPDVHFSYGTTKHGSTELPHLVTPLFKGADVAIETPDGEDPPELGSEALAYHLKAKQPKSERPRAVRLDCTYTALFVSTTIDLCVRPLRPHPRGSVATESLDDSALSSASLPLSPPRSPDRSSHPAADTRGRLKASRVSEPSTSQRSSKTPAFAFQATLSRPPSSRTAALLDGRAIGCTQRATRTMSSACRWIHRLGGRPRPPPGPRRRQSKLRRLPAPSLSSSSRRTTSLARLSLPPSSLVQAGRSVGSYVVRLDPARSTRREGHRRRRRQRPSPLAGARRSQRAMRSLLRRGTGVAPRQSLTRRRRRTQQ